MNQEQIKKTHAMVNANKSNPAFGKKRVGSSVLFLTTIVFLTCILSKIDICSARRSVRRSSKSDDTRSVHSTNIKNKKSSHRSNNANLDLRHVIVIVMDDDIDLNNIDEEESVDSMDVNVLSSAKQTNNKYDPTHINKLLGIEPQEEHLTQEHGLRGNSPPPSQAPSIFARDDDTQYVECHHEKSEYLTSKLSKKKEEYVLAVSACRDNQDFFDSLENNPLVLSIQDDSEVKLLENDGYKSNTDNDNNNLLRGLDEVVPYGITSIGADKVTTGSRDVMVCIVDSGIDIHHEDLPSSGIDGHDSTTLNGGEGEAWNVDYNGHGSHVSGIIFAQGNNGMGMRGVVGDLSNSNIKLHVTKGVGKNGGRVSDVISAIHQCHDAGANIINLSLGFSDSPLASQTFDELASEDIFLVAAAGNGGSSDYSFPASYAGVVSVGAVDYFNRLAYFSQRNDQVELTAPGTGIYSTQYKDYGSRHGTSMASPFVAGAAAVLLSKYPCTAQEIRNVFALTARKGEGGDAGCDKSFGFGIVQVDAAVKYLEDVGGCAGVEILLSGQGGCNIVERPISRAQDQGDIMEENEIFEEPFTSTTLLKPSTLPTSSPEPTPQPSIATESPTFSPTKSTKSSSCITANEKKKCYTDNSCCSNKCDFNTFTCAELFKTVTARTAAGPRCLGKNAACEKDADCCKNKCNKKKSVCNK
mmetsp:Transcript_49794/g.59910  ORF Transcript_49794/g.59910 Transcript_49794/m.59910 type:complete len:696 (-) Transcript_49794:385-2472(-)